MKPLVLVVVLALGLRAVPLSAAGADDTAGTPLTASIHRAVTTAAANSSPSTAPNPMPHRSGKAYFKRQGGGGSSMMVLGIVGALAGVAGTVYMVKEMNKQTNTIMAQPQPLVRFGR